MPTCDKIRSQKASFVRAPFGARGAGAGDGRAASGPRPGPAAPARRARRVARAAALICYINKLLLFSSRNRKGPNLLVRLHYRRLHLYIIINGGIE